MNPSQAVAFHAGDSRLYRITEAEVQQVTRDHSAAEMVGAHDESQLNPLFRGVIVRTVGLQAKVELEWTQLTLAEGDVLLLCSDGLYRMVDDARIGELVRRGGALDAVAESLIQAANEAGGTDNVTVLLARIGKLPAPSVGEPLAFSVPDRIEDIVTECLRKYDSPVRKDCHRFCPLVCRLALAAGLVGAVWGLYKIWSICHL